MVLVPPPRRAPWPSRPCKLACAPRTPSVPRLPVDCRASALKQEAAERALCPPESGQWNSRAGTELPCPLQPSPGASFRPCERQCSKRSPRVLPGFGSNLSPSSPHPVKTSAARTPAQAGGPVGGVPARGPGPHPVPAPGPGPHPVPAPVPSRPPCPCPRPVASAVSLPPSRRVRRVPAPVPGPVASAVSLPPSLVPSRPPCPCPGPWSRRVRRVPAPVPGPVASAVSLPRSLGPSRPPCPCPCSCPRPVRAVPAPCSCPRPVRDVPAPVPAPGPRPPRPCPRSPSAPSLPRSLPPVPVRAVPAPPAI
ncbi:tetra-peptide repeat homeobox protein 1-like [Melanerpes formicivorus]|uniref:tetra-peptide repeat homeobox protein 1-like n=1 Tax=Melanerpes formicivorus TaxID=211600 RepID=UPI00358FFCE3